MTLLLTKEKCLYYYMRMIITSLGQKIVVRYARKPIWMPTAPSKLFRIPEHTFYSQDEIKKIRSLHESYRAQALSVAEFMKHEFFLPASQSGGLSKEFIDKELENDKQIYEENDRENARIAKLKKEVMLDRIRETEDKLMEEKLRREEELLHISQKIDDFVREQKSDPDCVVTEENIEEMIEKAIESPVSHQFFIDKSGKKYGDVQHSEIPKVDLPFNFVVGVRKSSSQS